jgi:hypothetical protein
MSTTMNGTSQGDELMLVFGANILLQNKIINF